MEPETESGLDFGRIRYPSVGDRARCTVVRPSCAQAILHIFEVEGAPTPIVYRAILKGTGFSESEYVCDRLRRGDVLEVVIISYGENGLLVSEA